jgi:hypothetical protein
VQNLVFAHLGAEAGDFGVEGFDADAEAFAFAFAEAIVGGGGELGEGREGVRVGVSEV